MGGMGTDPTGLKSYCDSKGIHVQAYSPLGDGTSELITGQLVTGIGKAHNMTGAQVSLRWVIENGVPLSTKTTKESHLREDLGIFGFRSKTLRSHSWTLPQAPRTSLPLHVRLVKRLLCSSATWPMPISLRLYSFAGKYIG